MRLANIVVIAAVMGLTAGLASAGVGKIVTAIAAAIVDVSPTGIAAATRLRVSALADANE